MRKGWNGNFEAGYGNNDHYRAKGMANRFKNKMNLSINGTANDNGINSNQRIGANYSQNTQKLKYTCKSRQNELSPFVSEETDKEQYTRAFGRFITPLQEKQFQKLVLSRSSARHIGCLEKH